MILFLYPPMSNNQRRTNVTDKFLKLHANDEQVRFTKFFHAHGIIAKLQACEQSITLAAKTQVPTSFSVQCVVLYHRYLYKALNSLVVYMEALRTLHFM